MKQFLLAAAFVAPVFGFAQKISLRHQWTTDSAFKTPESIVYDKNTTFFYITNIEGQPSAKDGKGSIAMMSKDGKTIETDWITGLNAPKGIALVNNKLFIADIDEVVVADIASKAIEKKIHIENAKGLNDVAADPKGNVFVSDKQGKRIYKLSAAGEVQVYLEDLQEPNGLAIVDDNLYVLDKGSLLKVDASLGITNVAFGMLASTDGLVYIPGKGFIVSCWEGSLYHVSESGKQTLLLDTRPQKKNTADIYYDEETRLLYVPTFYQNTIEVYELE
jgi:DNA-binding beta-propeller fold protein YncE